MRLQIPERRAGSRQDLATSGNSVRQVTGRSHSPCDSIRFLKRLTPDGFISCSTPPAQALTFMDEDQGRPGPVAFQSGQLDALQDAPKASLRATPRLRHGLIQPICLRADPHKFNAATARFLQGLKPGPSVGPVGTTKAVPCYRASFAEVLSATVVFNLGGADPGLKAPSFLLIFRGLKPPAPSAKAICNCSISAFEGEHHENVPGK